MAKTAVNEKPLTQNQVEAIRASDAHPRFLAGSYDVSEETIRSIKSGQYVRTEYKDGRMKLSDMDCQMILGLKDRWPAKEIAARFKVDINYVHNIWAGDTRTHLRPPEGMVRTKDWVVKLLVLLLEKPRKPKELEELLNVSNPTIHRGLRLLRAAGFDIPGGAEEGKAANKRLYHIQNAKLTGPLIDMIDESQKPPIDPPADPPVDGKD